MTCRAAIFAVTLCLLPEDVCAKTTLGIGADTCRTWSNHARDGFWDIFAKFEDHQWLLGFLSARNVYGRGPDFLEHTDSQAVIMWVDNYCLQHPLDYVDEAAVTLIKELTRRVGGN
jgi:hypothetical protein